MRQTKKSIMGIYSRFITEFCKRTGGDPADYELDYIACYGGYVITCNYGDKCGVESPFGLIRRSASEMYRTLAFANDVVFYMK